MTILSAIAWSCDRKPYAQGEYLYGKYCSSCHMDNGSGLEGVIPPLAKADFYEANPNLLPCIIRHGWQDSMLVNGRWYTQPMAAVDVLNDVEIGNVINYINHSWYPEMDYISAKDVQSALRECPNIPQDTIPLKIMTK